MICPCLLVTKSRKHTVMLSIRFETGRLSSRPQKWVRERAKSLMRENKIEKYRE